MLFLTTIRIPTPNYRGALERFKAGGAPPPSGVKMLGRWHRADGSGTTVLCDASDAVALAHWAKEWADVISIEIAPVLTDEEMASVIA